MLQMEVSQLWGLVALSFALGMAGASVIYFLLMPFIKREINIAITGTADELHALEEAIRRHVLQYKRNRP